jgi:hypothetical protein
MSQAMGSHGGSPQGHEVTEEVERADDSEGSLICREQRWAHAQMAFSVDGDGETPESAAELRLQNSSLRAELKSTRSKLEHLQRQHEVR